MVSTALTKVSDNLYVLRINDDRTRFFEALWEIPEGITYNAYLLTLPEKTVLIDGWKKEFADEFINTISRVTDIKDIDYVVVNHVEPDHSGSLKKVLELNEGKATVLGHPFAKGLIESLVGVTPKFRAVKDGEVIDLGSERMRFIYTPWLHWPETIMTYLEERSVLLSCDAFGGYSIPPAVFDDDDSVIATYIPYVRKYFANVVGHYRDFVIKAIEKIRSLGITPKIVAPAHGLIWRRSLDIVSYYEKLAKGTPEKGKIAVIYTSMYGYVEKAVGIAIDSLRTKGFKAVAFRFTDKHRDSIADLIGEIEDAEAVIIGTATYEAEVYPLMKYVADLIIKKVHKRKPILIITTYGWGNVAGRKLEELFRNAGFETVATVGIKGLSSQKDIEAIKEGVENLVSKLSA